MTEVILTVYNDIDSVGSTIDLDGTEVIALNSTITDILSLDVRGTFTREFRIPLTSANQQFFGPIQNIGVDGWFDYNRKTRATLAVNTIPVAIGFIQIKKTFYTAESETWYLETTFFGETPDLARTVGEAKLADLTDLPSLDHVSTYADLAGSVALTFQSGDAIYALTDKGFNFSEIALPGTTPIFNSAYPLYGNQFTLCINEGYLFRQIMADAGFAIDAVSLLAELDTMWMPFIRDQQYTKCEEDITTEGFGVHLNADSTGNTVSMEVPGLTEDYDLGPNFASNEFTAPFTGWYSFFGQIRIERTTGSGVSSFQIHLVKNADDEVCLLGNNASIAVGGEHTFTFYSSDQQIFLNAGETVRLWIHRAPGGSGVYTIHSGAIDSSTGTWWKMTYVSPPAWGGNVIVANNAPDMKQMDFIRDKIKQFNLAVVPDRLVPNKIKFEPLIEFIGSGDDYDWTGKLAIDKDILIAPLTDTNSRTLLFTYGKEEDVLNKLYFTFAQPNRIYGQHKIDETDNDFATNDLKVELITRPTPCNAIPGTNIVIPKFLDDSGKFFKPGPRSLYYAGTADGVQVYDDVGLVSTSTEVILLNHMSTVDGGIGTSDYDLNFGVDIPLQAAVVPYKNLYFRWYKNYINQLYDSEARTLEAYFALELIDIIKLKFSDRMYVVVNGMGSWWRLLEMMDFPLGTGGVVKCKLIRVLDSLVDCEWTPLSVGVSGLVEFLSVDGVTTGDGTRACCERYGYTWSDFNSACFAFDGGRPEAPAAPGMGIIAPGEPITFPSAIGTPTIEVATNYAVTLFFSTYFVDASGGAITLTLPPLASVRIGTIFSFKKTDSSGNNMTVDGDGSETIDRSTTQSKNTQDAGFTIQSGTTEWSIISEK